VIPARVVAVALGLSVLGHGLPAAMLEIDSGRVAFGREPNLHLGRGRLPLEDIPREHDPIRRLELEH